MPPAPSALFPGLRLWRSGHHLRSDPGGPRHGTTPEGISAQAEQSCKNVGAILEAAGSGFDKVVKTTCFLADMGDFAAFNEVYAKYFTSKPARSCVAVKDLPRRLCEIEPLLSSKPRPASETIPIRFCAWEIRSFFTCPQRLF